MSKKIDDISSYDLPKPSLEHLKRLTDDTGIFQHARFIVPDRLNGYTTDDNARALIVTAKYYKQFPDPEALRLFEIYMAFLCYALKTDGTAHNFMDYNRNWRTGQTEHDSLGRTLRAFGSVIASPPSPVYLSITKEFFSEAAKHIPILSPRGMSYAILGLVEYLGAFPQEDDLKRQLADVSEKLANLHRRYATKNWDWFENILSYDNAILPAALFAAGMALGEKKYLDIAERACKFLLANTYNGKHFSFVGSDNWYLKGKERSKFDQQPIEVAGTVLMLRNAYRATKNPEYLQLERKAFDWFLGDNDLHLPMYDSQTKGCCDGLGPDNINTNQGAESIVSFLLALLNITEPV
jgi:uncharacterized protein YyaL (SSP411 family)